MDAAAAIGIDLGGTNAKIALVSSEGGILTRQTQPCDTTCPPDEFVRRLADAAMRLAEGQGVLRGQLIGVGVGTPGPLDLKSGRIIRTANLPGWEDVPVRDLLHEATKLDVVLDNDGNVAALGEHRIRSPEDRCDMVMLTLGTGVGGGVIIDDCILHGHFDNAAEMGHMIVVPDGLLCPCGQRGCLEQYSSAGAVTTRVRTAVREGTPSILARRIMAGEQIDARDVAKSTLVGDAVCVRIWDEACAHLASACVNLQHILNPGMIVLGGGMSQAGALLLDGVKSRFESRKWSLHNDFPRIELARLGYDAGVVGAGLLAWTTFGPVTA